MLCPKCKKQLKDGSKFCGYCGNKFNNAASKSVSVSTVKKYVPLKKTETASPSISSPPPTPTLTVESNVATCKYCGSTSLQAMKQGVNVGKAVAGALLVGPLGLAAGAAGMNNTKIVCLNCGKEQ